MGKLESYKEDSVYEPNDEESDSDSDSYYDNRGNKFKRAKRRSPYMKKKLKDYLNKEWEKLKEIKISFQEIKEDYFNLDFHS